MKRVPYSPSCGEISLREDFPMILKCLKLATSACHTALEDQLPLMRSDLSRGEYRQFVGRFFGFYAPLEILLMASNHWQLLAFDYAARHPPDWC